MDAVRTMSGLSQEGSLDGFSEAEDSPPPTPQVIVCVPCARQAGVSTATVSMMCISSTTGIAMFRACYLIRLVCDMQRGYCCCCHVQIRTSARQVVHEHNA